MKVAIIGAGPGGLVSAKYCLAEGYSVDIFEQNPSIGGVWVYSNHVDTDDYGLPIQAAMYKGLRTNVPKELMEYSDFPYPKEVQASYLDASEVLQYFENYADKFNLRQCVKLRTKVIEVTPLEGEKWNVKALNLMDKTLTSGVYDAVVVANGHHEERIIPDIPGKKTFSGIQLHSKDFRSANDFRNKRCLVVGMGLSGQDVSRLLLNVTDIVFASHRSDKKLPNISKRIIEKPCVSRIEGRTVLFEDGSSEEVDVILYCTGYKYYFPFLTKDCGITVEASKWVKPLYKEIINIEHPTMCFIGLQFNIPVIALFDLQARFFVSTLNGYFTLPSKEAMLEDFRKKAEYNKKLGIPLKHMHGKMVMELRKDYYNDVAETAKIQKIPPVILNLFEKILAERMKGEYRQASYKIESDSKFKTIVNSKAIMDEEEDCKQIINGRYL